MTRPLEGKVAAVTGGTRGIGYAIAHRLLDAGASVAICGRSRDGLDAAVRNLTGLAGAGALLLGEVADVGREEQVSAFFRRVDERFRRLDILINNAGIGVFAAAAELTPEEFRRVLETNVNGAFYCSHEALVRFRNSGGGYIVNISSLAGKNPFAGGAAYNASKFGLNGLSEAMMLDHRYDNVRVSYIMPGSVDTGFGRSEGGEWKISPYDIADIVMMLLYMPERTLISRVEVRPSRPKR
jgi:NAD(P)-dependent dehydrogenase (short-subunit alcohol dehydrogenase family)